MLFYSKISSNIIILYIMYVIQISPSIINITEADTPVTINVTVTVPVACQGKEKECKVKLELVQDNPDDLINICSLAFNNSHVGQSNSFKVVATRDFVDDGDKETQIAFHVPVELGAQDWKQYFKIPNILVRCLFPVS